MNFLDKKVDFCPSVQAKLPKKDTKKPYTSTVSFDTATHIVNKEPIFTTESEESEQNSEIFATAFSIWSVLALLSFILRCLLLVLCISTTFVIFVLVTHQHSDSRYTA